MTRSTTQCWLVGALTPAVNRKPDTGTRMCGVISCLLFTRRSVAMMCASALNEYPGITGVTYVVIGRELSVKHAHLYQPHRARIGSEEELWAALAGD